MKIKITWKAFGDKPQIGRFVSSVEFETEGFVGQNINEISHESICNALYKDTNWYQGLWWNIIEPLLSPTRTHTSLSIGDEIQINDITYVVADFGFIKKEDAVYRYMDDMVFSVRKADALSITTN